MIHSIPALRSLFFATLLLLTAHSAAFAQEGEPTPAQRMNHQLKPIDAIVLPGAPPAKQPTPDYAVERFGDEPMERQGPGVHRPWSSTLYAWEAPALCHRPLYFEEENLERYGQSFGVFQPAISAGQFYGRALALPYLMGAYPSHQCYYTLGKGTPGTYMPYYLHRPPVSARGALYQAGAVTGLSFFVP